MKIVFGIDLGTTNSALAAYVGGVPEIVPVQGGRTIPSVVWYHPDGTTTVGNEAYKRKGQSDVIFSSKRDMGTSTVYHLTLEDGSTKDVTPIDVASEVLKAIVRDCDKKYGEVKEAVITVPAYFEEPQRTATRKAAELAGIKLLTIINEPTAASLAYGLNKEKNIAENVIVCDIGGGTTDVTLMFISNFDTVPEELKELVPTGLNFSVISTSGNNRLGGDDYDNNIIDCCRNRLLKENEATRKSIDKSDNKKKADCTRLKKFIHKNFTNERYKPWVELWKKSDASRSMVVGCTDPDTEEKRELVFNPSDLDKGFEPFWEKIETCIDDALVRKVIDDDGNEIIIKHIQPTVCLPVGGSTKNPRLLDKLREKFAYMGLTIPNNSFADEAVALGAAVEAAIFTGIESNITLKEVNPLPIGIEVVSEQNGILIDDIFAPIIPKDVTVPIKRAFNYSTTVDNQEALDIRVYQGLNSKVSLNQKIGVLEIPNLPAKPAGEVSVDVVFEVDFSGQLTVRAFLDGQTLEAHFNSVLNASRRKYTKAEEKTFAYLANVRDYLEAQGLKDSIEYSEVVNWVPGKPIPEYAIKNRKDISAWVTNKIQCSVTELFKDSVITKEEAEQYD